jgi:hypothetical protein
MIWIVLSLVFGVQSKFYHRQENTEQTLTDQDEGHLRWQHLERVHSGWCSIWGGSFRDGNEEVKSGATLVGIFGLRWFSDGVVSSSSCLC